MKMMSEEKIHEKATEAFESLRDEVKLSFGFFVPITLIPLLILCYSVIFNKSAWIFAVILLSLMSLMFFFLTLRPYILACKKMKNRTYSYEYLDIDEYRPSGSNVVAIYHYNGAVHTVPLGRSKITEDTLRPKKVHVFDFGHPDMVEAFIDDEEEA